MRTVTVVHFTDQNQNSKTVYCIRCMMVCKIGFTNWTAKISLLRASMVVPCYIKLFRTGADRHNGILMYLLLLVAETIIVSNINICFSVILKVFWNHKLLKLCWRSFDLLHKSCCAGIKKKNILEIRLLRMRRFFILMDRHTLYTD